MNQFQIENNTVTLSVKKGPLLVRTTLFFFASVSVIAPLTAIAFSVSDGSGLKLGYILGPILFGIMGFYMLRLALWNTYGREIVVFENNIMIYTADYGWFKDGTKTKPLSDQVAFHIERIGYEEDHKGRMIIQLPDDQIKCVTVMQIREIEKLIEQLVQKIPGSLV